MYGNRTLICDFRFLPQRLQIWSGRYRRVPGESYAFHLRRIDERLQVVILWNLDDSIYTCRAIDSLEVRSLAHAISEAKINMGGNGSGSFLINEFGQVLVPASDDLGNRMLVGEVRGSIKFHNVMQGGTFTLGDDSGLFSGDEWQLPYLGIPYNLSARGRIYFKHSSEDEEWLEFLDEADRALVNSLRSIREYGSVRFLVNPSRVVLTKKYQKGVWGPVYVGRLNLVTWFDKEE